MTMTSVRLASSLQTLIDTRLDTIERMLMGRVTRQDRQSIVKDVETQIFDILQEGRNDRPTREDVLAALARLDPPEAYLPEDGETVDERPAVARRPATMRPIVPLVEQANSRKCMVSFAFGLSAILLSLLHLIFLLNDRTVCSVITSRVLLFATCFVTPLVILSAAGAGFVLAIVARYRRGWTITGGILSTISLLYALISGTFLLTFVLTHN